MTRKGMAAAAALAGIMLAIYGTLVYLLWSMTGPG